MDRRRVWGLFQTNILLVATMLAAYLAFPTAGARAEGPLEVLQVGWDGTVVPGSWSPVRVRVTGGAADANVRVEVVLKYRYQPGPQTTPIDYPVGAYGQEVALPAGVAKEITLWIPAEGGYGGPPATGGTVQMTSGDRLLAEEKVDFRTTRAPYWPLVGVLAESPVLGRALSQVEMPVQGLPISLSTARLAAADLPTSAERLSALSGLVVQGNAAAALTGEQRRAVQDWVASGGHLLLAGGPEAPRAAAVLPTGTLPVTFEGAAGAVDLAALARWSGVREGISTPGPAARFRAAAGSALAGTVDRPLVWRLGLGRGTVTLLAADPSLEPLASWAGTPALLQKALEPALPGPTENEKMRYLQMQERDTPARLQGAVEALPPEAFPDWRTVALILGGFALVVGPLLHLLLWRADRRGWMWVAVPAAALLISSALYYVGIGRDGRDVLANVVAHVRLDPETGQARQTLAAGFFAPTHSKLAVTAPGDLPLRVISRWYGPYGPGGVPAAASTEPPFHVIEGRNARVEFDSGQWTMRSVSMVRSLGQEEMGRITARLGLEEGILKGTLRNDTPYFLEDAAVVVGRGVVKLGSLAPGQTAQVVLDPGPPVNPFEGGFPLSWRLLGRPAGPNASGGMVITSRVPAPAVAVAPAVPVKPTPTPAQAAPQGRNVEASPTPAGTPTATPTSVPTPTMAAAAQVPSGARAVPPVPPGGMPERLELPQDPEIQRRVRLLDPIVNVPRPGPGGQSLPLTFLAFTRAPVGKDLPSVGNHPTYYLTLLEQPLRLDLPPGPFTMPASLVPPDILEQTTGGFGGGSNGTFSWIQLQGGSITYGFRLPLPPKAKAEALTVTTQQMGASAQMVPGKGMAPPGPNLNPGPAEDGVFSVYNWQSAGWEPLPGGQEQTRLAPASPYIGPDGLVKLQVSAGIDRVVQFVLPELAVEGRVVE